MRLTTVTISNDFIGVFTVLPLTSLVVFPGQSYPNKQFCYKTRFQNFVLVSVSEDSLDQRKGCVAQDTRLKPAVIHVIVCPG